MPEAFSRDDGLSDPNTNVCNQGIHSELRKAIGAAYDERISIGSFVDQLNISVPW